jgi:hypothetical protein
MVCSRKTTVLTASFSQTLKEFIADISQKLSLKNPSLDSSKGTLFMPANKSTHTRLDLTFTQLKEQGLISGVDKEEWEILDPVIPNVLYVQMSYTEGDETMK